MDTATREHYLADFERVAAALPGAMARRRAALERFADLGFPGVKNEDWKYTNLAALEKRRFVVANGSHGGVSAALVNELTFGADCHLLVFVDGRYAPHLSRLMALPAGVKLGNLAAFPEALEIAEQEGGGDGLAALNSAFLSDGAYLNLPDGAALEQPLHLLFIAGTPDTAVNVRNLIVAGDRAQATVIEHYAGLSGAAYFTNTATKIVLGQEAQIEHCKLQQESVAAFHIAAIQARQERASRFTSHSISLGAALARNDIATRLAAPGCEAVLNGLYWGGGKQHVDHHTTIDHAMPQGTSREFYRGVLGDAARGVFNGKVIVREGAQQSDASQANHNLLLSNEAEVDTKPQLEIYADDVKCRHGATVGQLDEDMIFYLRSRGIAQEAAKTLLTYAFARDVIGRLNLPPLRAKLEQMLIARLPHGAVIREFV